MLNSGDGTGLFEHLDAVNHALIEEGYVVETAINESLNEADWDQDLSTGAMAVGTAGVAGAVGLAAYIAFLFKKKKIRKAWDEVKDIQIAKIDKDVQAYEDEADLKLKLIKQNLNNSMRIVTGKH